MDVGRYRQEVEDLSVVDAGAESFEPREPLDRSRHEDADSETAVRVSGAGNGMPSSSPRRASCSSIGPPSSMPKAMFRRSLANSISPGTSTRPPAPGAGGDGLQHPQNGIHARTEVVDRQEQICPDRSHHVAHVLDRRQVLERSELRCEGGASHDAAEDVDDERDRRSLRPAERQDGAGERALRVSRRMPVRIDGPAVRDRLSCRAPRR